MKSSERQHCDFCYALFTPPGKWRAPSGACDRCWLEIRQAMERPEPDFSPENCKRITFIPEVFYEI